MGYVITAVVALVVGFVGGFTLARWSQVKTAAVSVIKPPP